MAGNVCLWVRDSASSRKSGVPGQPQPWTHGMIVLPCWPSSWGFWTQLPRRLLSRTLQHLALLYNIAFGEPEIKFQPHCSPFLSRVKAFLSFLKNPLSVCISAQCGAGRWAMVCEYQRSTTVFFPGFELRSPSLSSKHLIYLLSYLTSPSCQLLQIPSIKSLGNTDDQTFILLFSFYLCLKKKKQTTLIKSGIGLEVVVTQREAWIR